MWMTISANAKINHAILQILVHASATVTIIMKHYIQIACHAIIRAKNASMALMTHAMYARIKLD